MANENKPFGFKPIQYPMGGIRQTPYRIVSGCPQEFFIGDIVELANVSWGSPGPPVTNTLSIAFNLTYDAYAHGVILGLIDPYGKPAMYHPNDTEDIGDWTAMVCDDPHQRYIVQEDSVGGSMISTGGLIGIFNGIGDIKGSYTGMSLDGSFLAGNKKTGISGFAISSANLEKNSMKQIWIVDLYPTPDNELGDYSVWIVEINNHFLK